MRGAGGWTRSPGREVLALAVAWCEWCNRFGLKRLESGWADGNDELGWGKEGACGVEVQRGNEGNGLQYPTDLYKQA